MILLIAVCVSSGFIISTLVTALMRRFAPRWGLVDHPNARKVHVTPTPMGGGIGIWVGVVVPLAAAQLAGLWLEHMSELPTWFPHELERYISGIRYRSGEMWGILCGATIISVLGLIDDLKTLRWQPKLLVQLLVACALASIGVCATLFTTAPWVGWIVSVVWIVVLTNAFNFLDNMDGLSGGIALIASIIFASIMLAATDEPRWLVAALLLILVGALFGFLVHNWSPAKIFMGDAGSCFIGMLLACVTIVGTFYDYHRSTRHVMLAPLCVLAVPLYDFCSVVIIRLLQGRSPFHADKSHFSHRLVEMGLSRPNAVLTIYLVTLTTGLGGLLLYQLDSWMGAALVLALIVCVLAVIAILETAALKSCREEAATRDASSSVEDGA